MSRLLAQVITGAKERIQTAGQISLFLDYDGTLVPITADPAMPRLDADTAETLKLLSSNHHLVTTIISGRAVVDLMTRVRLERLIYAGNHGLEISGRNLRFVEPVALSRKEILARLGEELTAELRNVAGTVVEFKGLTASIHYRQASEADRTEIQQVAYAGVARYNGLFRVCQGRKVLEILPRTNWDKGAAVRWINSQLDGNRDLLSICLGDDRTDEDIFRALPEAVTIKVGAGPATSARYQLPDPAAVHEFLVWLAIQEVTRVKP